MVCEVLIEDPRWSDLGLEALALKASEAALEHFGLDSSVFEISLMGCDDARIAELNAEFREKPVATNVLSWPSDERAAQEDGELPEFPGDDPWDRELGDIALAYETCVREAHEANKPIDNHIVHLIVHGVLHCLGFDHIRDKDASLMEGHETLILEKLGISDPYSHGLYVG